MTAGTVKWATWLPMVAAGAVAAYALPRRPAYRAGRRGTAAIADRDSDTRQQLGGRLGYSRRAGHHRQQASGGSLPLLAQLREFSDVHEASAFRVTEGSRNFPLGRTRAGRARCRMGRANHQRDRRQTHCVAVARRFHRLNRRVRSTSGRRRVDARCGSICNTSRLPERLALRSGGSLGGSPAFRYATTCGVSSN